MIELGYIPPKIQQCEFCGRVKLEGVWKRDGSVRADVVTRCPTCSEWRKKVAKAKYYREARAVARDLGRPHETSEPDWERLKGE